MCLKALLHWITVCSIVVYLFSPAPLVGVSNDGTVGCICLCLHLVCKIMPYLTKFDGVERAPIRYTSQDKESGPFLKAGPNLLTNLIRLVVPTGFIYKLPGLSLSK